MALRVNPVLAFGWVNSFLGISQVGPKIFFLSTALGIQSDIVVKTYVGVLLRDVGDFAAETAETQDALQGQLIVQIIIFLFFLSGGYLYARWILNNVLHDMNDDSVSMVTWSGVI